MKIPDQSEVQTKLEVLRLTCQNLAAAIQQATGENIASPSLTKDVLTDISTLEGHKAALQQRLNSIAKGSDAGGELDRLRSENTQLKQNAVNVEAQVNEQVARKLATAVVEVGICDKPAKGGVATKDLTTTQKVLHAKGLPLDTKVALGLREQPANPQ